MRILSRLKKQKKRSSRRVHTIRHTIHALSPKAACSSGAGVAQRPRLTDCMSPAWSHDSRESGSGATARVRGSAMRTTSELQVPLVRLYIVHTCRPHVGHASWRTMIRVSSCHKQLCRHTQTSVPRAVAHTWMTWSCRVSRTQSDWHGTNSHSQL